MVLVRFAANIALHCPVHDIDVPPGSVAQVLDAAFADLPRARSYVLDDQGALRRHMAAFVDGEQIADRLRLSDPVAAGSTVDVIQALSGG